MVWSNLDADVDFVSVLSFFLQCVGDTEGLHYAIWLLLPGLWCLLATKFHLQPVRQYPNTKKQERINSAKSLTNTKRLPVTTTTLLLYFIAVAYLSARLATLSWSLGKRRATFQKIRSGGSGIYSVTSAGRLIGAHTASLGGTSKRVQNTALWHGLKKHCNQLKTYSSSCW